MRDSNHGTVKYWYLEKEVDLEWWLRVYGTEPHPARYMNKEGLTYGRGELLWVTRKLTELDGVQVGESHVWKALGKVYYPGTQNMCVLFCCVPTSPDRLINTSSYPM